MNFANRTVWTYLALLLIYLFPTINGILSRNFGVHWDESATTLAVARSYLTGSFIQDWTAYPSFLYYQTIVASLPHLVKEVATEEQLITREGFVTELDASQTQHSVYSIPQPALRDALSRTAEYVLSEDFMLTARGLSCAISYLSVLWLFFIGRTLLKSDLAGLLAALIFAGSWEVLYHSRWLATDLIMIQWGLLSLLMLLKFIENSKTNFLFFAGLFAGIATATKFQGGLYWLLSLVAIVVIYRNSRITALRLMLISFGSYLTGFILFNPVVIFTPVAFVEGFVYNLVHYATGHGPWTIESGLTHGWSIFYYATTQLSSRYILIALVTSLFAVLGAYQCWRDRRWAALLLFLFPVVYWLYFSKQNVMIVRNYLCLLPFIAIFGAHGGMHIWEISGKYARGACLGILGIAALVNGAWIVHSSRSIVSYDLEENNAALIKLIGQREGNILVSDEIWALLSEQEREHRKAMNREATSEPEYIAIGYEILKWALPANKPGAYNVLLGGPFEINFEYYPGFSVKALNKWRFVEISGDLVAGRGLIEKFNG